jgi:hypothetical protein
MRADPSSATSILNRRFGLSRTELLLFLLLWVTYAYFYQSTGTNEAVRFDQMQALVHDHTLAIDKYCFNSPDLIRYPEGTGQIYPNKAPGMTFLGVVPFALGSVILFPIRAAGLPEWISWHVLCYFSTLFSVSLLSAVAAVGMYRVLTGLTSDRYFSAVIVLAVWLGTLLFPYSTLFYSHAPTASLLVIAFYLLYDLRGTDVAVTQSARIVKAWLAGALAGCSVAVEYPALLLSAILGLYGAWAISRLNALATDKRRLLGMFVLGGVAGGAVLILYNLCAFGSPFYVPYEAYSKSGTSFHSTYTQGWMGLHWSGLTHFLNALASIFVYRPSGLFHIVVGRWYIHGLNPVLWLSLPGLVMMIWSRKFRSEGLMVAAMLAAYALFIANYGSSMYDWGGGLYLGPRHLIPLIGFLALPLYFGAQKMRWLFYPLAAVSTFYMLIGTATEPRIAFPFGDIARDFLLPDYLTGHFAQNTSSLFDAAHRALTYDSTAFNLAKLLHIPGPYQLVPLMIWWVITGAILLKSLNQTRDKFWSNANSALVLFATGIAVAPIIHQAVMAPRGNAHGLLAKYYRNASWAGTPADIKIDRFIDFDWSKSTPYPAPFSVEWTGNIIVDREGYYMFTLIADDGALLEIDDGMVVDARRSLLQEKERTISLTRGLHSIRVRYYNELFGGSVKLWWTLLGRPRQIVPNEALIPATTK